MAQFTIDIPDLVLPRIVTAFKRLLVEGDAIDLDNPTNAEIRDKLKSICIKHLKGVLKEQETQLNYETLEFNDINIT